MITANSFGISAGSFSRIESILKKKKQKEQRAQPIERKLASIAHDSNYKEIILPRSWTDSEREAIDWVLNYIDSSVDEKHAAFFEPIKQRIAKGPESPDAVSGVLHDGLILMRQLIEQELAERQIKIVEKEGHHSRRPYLDKNKYVWTQDENELIGWFLNARNLPIAPFSLKQGETVVSETLFYERLREEIGYGPTSIYSRNGKIYDMLKSLKKLTD